MLKRFISYYRPHRRLFILDMLASLTVSMVGILYPVITRFMLNELIPQQRYRIILLCGAGLLLLYIVRMLLNYFIQYYGHVMGVRMQAQMRSDMFRHLERLPYSFYDNHETGKIMSRMTNDLQDISELAHHGPENIIISTVSVIISFVYLCTINWKLTLTIFICIPFLLAAALILRRKMREAFRQSRVSIAQINAALESSISGIRVTKAFTNQAKEEEKFEEGNRSYIKARSEAYRAMGQFHSTTSFITDVFNVIVLVAGGLILFGAFGGEVMQIGDYTAFVASVSLFITPVMTLINFMEHYQPASPVLSALPRLWTSRWSRTPPVPRPSERCADTLNSGTSPTATGTASRCWTASVWTSAPAKPLHWWDLPAAARPLSVT